LGTLIFNGIATDHAPKIWTGAIAVCALAVAADLALFGLERVLKARRAA
jgi:ABC-type proline/glycine betaine transport system permease subunit